MATSAAVVADYALPSDALASTPLIVNDITLLDPVRVARIASPQTNDDIQTLLRGWQSTISVGGGCYSMGGQIAEENSLHLDMRQFNRLVAFDPQQRIIRVQAGMRWRDLQTIIDPHNLAVKIMQSYSNFTIGGALSVNCHGRYVTAGPIINSVRAISIIMADGTALEASRTQNTELFYGAIGGYGGLGVIAEVEFDLVPNIRMKREVRRIALADYPSFFRDKVAGRMGAIMHNGDIDPQDSENLTSITWFETQEPVTVPERLFPIGASFAVEKTEVEALASLPASHLLRRMIVDPIRYAGRPVVWRNHEASMDVASLGQIANADGTYALQEYFIPTRHFGDFAQRMLDILRSHNVNALNVSVRHAPVDPGSFMAWAREEVFSFVLYYWQSSSRAAQYAVGDWTR